MRKDEVLTFIEAMKDLGAQWKEEDVERVYGTMSLEDALAIRRGDLIRLAGILGNLVNN